MKTGKGGERRRRRRKESDGIDEKMLVLTLVFYFIPPRTHPVLKINANNYRTKTNPISRGLPIKNSY